MHNARLGASEGGKYPLVQVFPARLSLSKSTKRIAEVAGAVSPDLHLLFRRLQDARVCTLARKKHKLNAGI